MRIGAIGIDSSHLPAFAARINTLNDAGKTRCRVTSFWNPGVDLRPHAAGTTESRAVIERWRAETVNAGAVEAGTVEELLRGVDGVMVLSVNGHRHLDLARAPLHRGMPVFVDKPLTCSISQALELAGLCERTGGRCFSASALRFAAEVGEIPRERLGRITSIEAIGGGERLEGLMAGLWFYGCHTVELVGAIWGGGVERVRAEHRVELDRVEIEYQDGRTAHLRLERPGGAFGAKLRGTGGEHRFEVEMSNLYAGLVSAMTKFFEGGPAPVGLTESLEMVMIVEAAHKSMSEAGGWIDLGDLAERWVG